jgi:hypothetical protein
MIMKKGERKTEKKRKIEIEFNIKKHQRDKINIEREGYKTYFEVIDSTGILHTYDVAEGVAAMMMCEHQIEDEIWKITITEKDKKEISAAKALYWLTGGNNEWVEISNYKVNWHEASVIFKKKFGGKITRIVRKAKTLADIKAKFEENFNLTELYEFAIKNNMI